MFAETYILLLGGSLATVLLGIVIAAVKGQELTALTLLSLAGIMFAALALNSLNIEDRYCENQINQTTQATVDNLTQTNYTNTQVCTTTRRSEEAMAVLFGGLSAVIFMLVLYFGFNMASKYLDRRY